MTIGVRYDYAEMVDTTLRVEKNLKGKRSSSWWSEEEEKDIVGDFSKNLRLSLVKNHLGMVTWDRDVLNAKRGIQGFVSGKTLFVLRVES